MALYLRRIMLMTFLPSFIVAFSTAKAARGDRTVGAGIVLGNPSALNLKIWRSQRDAFDAGLAFAYNDSVVFYGDYLYHFPGAFQRDRHLNQLIPYLGIGAAFVITTKERRDEDGYYGKKSGSLGLGVRIPLGLEWRPGDPPLGIFLEIVPGLAVIPETQSFVQGGIGIRYYF